MRFRIYIIVFICFFCSRLSAQFVDLGQDPFCLKWRQINTENFQLIYPDFFEEKAQYIANIYSLLYRESNSLGQKPKKISMVIHTTGGISNGSAGWAPKKSDLYAVPSQDPQDPWWEHLCVHEFRHVVQYDKINRGFTNFLYYIFGEQMVMAVVGLYIPMWFLEGDAVSFETAVGHIGRGRSPEFINEMKAQVLEKGIFHYDKAVLGSYRDFIPNRYTMGYFMVGNTRKNYGSSIWADALQNIGKRSYSLVPFKSSLKRSLTLQRDSLWKDSVFTSVFIAPEVIKENNTHKNAVKTLYHDNFTELKARWEKEAAETNYQGETIPTDNLYFTGYHYPTPLPDGGVIAYKEGFRESGAFVLLSQGEEKVLFRTAPLYDYKFAIQDSMIVWSEYIPHLRWEHKGRMTLATYHLNTGRYRNYSSTYNRFSPFACNGSWGVVEVDYKNECKIILFDSSLSRVLKTYAANPGELFIHPSYTDEKIITVVQSKEGNFIQSIDITTGEKNALTEPEWYEIDNPLLKDNFLYYRASYDGNNAIYRKNFLTGMTEKIIESPFGVRYPYFYKDSIFISLYTSQGYKPGVVQPDRFLNTPVEKKSFALADSLIKFEDIRLSRLSDSIFPSKRYRKLPHALNIHSWGPMYVNQFDQEINPGLIIYSQNKLSTLSFAGGYIFNGDYERGGWMLNVNYNGLWPKFSIDIKSGLTDVWVPVNLSGSSSESVVTLGYKSRFSTADFSVTFPFNLSGRNYYRSLQPYIRYKLEHVASHRYQLSDFFYIPIPKRYYQIMEYGVRFMNQTHTTTQEMKPRWGQTIQVGYKHLPWKEYNIGEQWWATGYFYFPGLQKNHSLTLYGGYQYRKTGSGHSNSILLPRGSDGAYPVSFFTMRNSYEFPILYPDIHIGSLIYFKALKGGIFYDFVKHKSTYDRLDYHSYGMELTSDCHLLRLPFPVNLGLRAGYETQTDSWFADLLFSVNFYF